MGNDDSNNSAPSSLPDKSPSSTTGTTDNGRIKRSRATNACEACKKRKAKCSGAPGPCVACQKNNAPCHFNLKLDRRRKIAFKPTDIDELQQYMLDGLVKILRYNDIGEIQAMLEMIRSDAPPRELATCLKRNLITLQEKGKIVKVDLNEDDLISVGLRDLFEEASEPRLKSETPDTPSSKPAAVLDGADPGPADHFTVNPSISQTFQPAPEFNQINTDFWDPSELGMDNYADPMYDRPQSSQVPNVNNLWPKPFSGLDVSGGFPAYISGPSFATNLHDYSMPYNNTGYITPQSYDSTSDIQTRYKRLVDLQTRQQKRENADFEAAVNGSDDSKKSRFESG